MSKFKYNKWFSYIFSFFAILAFPLTAFAMAPLAPSNLVATSVEGSGSASAGMTISWQDNSLDESAFQIEKSTNGVDWQVIGTVSANATAAFVNQSSLSTNTQYWFRIAAKSVLSELSAYAATTVGTYSSAVIPSLTVTGSTSGNISLAINANGNPNYTKYAIRNLTTGKFLKADGSVSGDTAVDFYTAAQWNGWATGLLANTSYSFDIRTRNEAGLITNPSNATPGQMLSSSPLDPASLAVTVNSMNSLAINWSGSLNEYYVQNVTTGAVSGWINARSFTFGNLSCDTAYAFTVKGRTSANAESASATVNGATPSCSTTVVPPVNFPPASCPALSAGTLIKVQGQAAIYALDSQSRVLYFPGGPEFKSWNKDDFYAGYYVTISQDCYDGLPPPSAYPLAVGFRAGSYIVKRAGFSQLYVVLPGNMLAKITPGAANALYGRFSAKIISEVAWPQYTDRGNDIVNAKAHEGMLVRLNGKIWYVDTGLTLREVTNAGFSANRFKQAFVHPITAAMVQGYATDDTMADFEDHFSNRTGE